MTAYDWLSFIEHQFVNGACPLFITLKMFSLESCMENMSMNHSFHADMSLVTRRDRMPHSIKKQ